MPGNVQNAAPATVLPLSLCKSFVHERAYPLIENEYKNGESQRSVLATTVQREMESCRSLFSERFIPFTDSRQNETD
jgi:hypothetical protein